MEKKKADKWIAVNVNYSTWDLTVREIAKVFKF